MERPKSMFGRWRRRVRIEEDAVNKIDVRGKVDVKTQIKISLYFYIIQVFRLSFRSELQIK